MPVGPWRKGTVQVVTFPAEVGPVIIADGVVARIAERNCCQSVSKAARVQSVGK